MDIGLERQRLTSTSSDQTPGFLIRRLNQIYLALFAEESAGFEITPVQLNVLSAVAREAGRDQSAIARETGIDRATMASVVARLEIAKLLRRTIGQTDQRQKLLFLTARGKTIVSRMQDPVLRASERVLAPLSAKEQKVFLTLLASLVEGGNHNARTEFLPPDRAGEL